MDLHKTLAYWWRQLRSVIENDSYERYLHHHATAHSNMPPMDRRSFYLKELERKWNGVRRCC